MIMKPDDQNHANQVSENMPNDIVNQNNASKKYKKIIILVGITIVIAAIVLFIATGRLHIKFTFVNSSISSRSVACSDEDREAFYSEYAKSDMDKDKLKSLKDKIVSDLNYDKNPDCVYAALLYESNIAYNEPESQRLFAILNELVNKGTYADNKYTSISDINSLKYMVDNMKDIDKNKSSDGIG